jgi:hypothetical protein
MGKITQVTQHAAIADIRLFANIVAFVECVRTHETEEVLEESRGQLGDVIATGHGLDGVVDTGALAGELGARPEVVQQAHGWGVVETRCLQQKWRRLVSGVESWQGPSSMSVTSE